MENTTKYMIDLRREFHKNPEISFKEYNTSKRIQEELEEMGIPYKIVAGTGVVGEIIGAKSGKTIALRADMDALQVNEENDIEYVSTVPGVMHACGHDGHMATLLGAAKDLVQRKDEIAGTVRLIFQPGEELGKGAKIMVEEGVMEGVDRFFSMHLWADKNIGEVSIETGPRMAAVGVLKIDIKGKGGHGSMPHQGVDAILVASAMVQNLQSISSRETSPMDPIVVSIGKMTAGTRFNVIAENATLEGTTRAYSPDIIKSLPQTLKRYIENTANLYNAEATFDHVWQTIPVINDEKVTNDIRKVVTNIYGEQALSNMEKVTGGEDASFFMEKCPGAFAFVGCKKDGYPHHHSKFDIDEKSLEIGKNIFREVVLDFLKKEI